MDEPTKFPTIVPSNAFNNAFEKENVVEGGWSQYDRILERQFYNHGLMPEE